MMKPEFPILRRLQLIFFRICNVGAIGGAAVAVVFLLMTAWNAEPKVSVAACAVVGAICLTGFWLFARQIDKIKNDF